MLGVTKAKRRVKKDLGIYKVTRITNMPTNVRRRVNRKTGYESEPMSFLRFLKRIFK